MPGIVVLGISSSISAYKACEVLRGFQRAGYAVQVVMTRHATRLVTPLLLSTLSGRKTIVELFDETTDWSVAHVALAKEATLLCVAPATANVIAKFAAGIADDFLTTFYLAARCPVLVAPAMNEAMLLHPRTEANLARLKASGVTIVTPEAGYLACGDEGRGRLAEPAAVVAEGLRLMGRTRTLAGRKVLVTAGPTREPIDPVRFLSNPSSGKMGFALAAEAAARGADVVLVTGPATQPVPAGVGVVRVVTAEEMRRAVRRAYPKADVVIMAAAVSDFRFDQGPAPESQEVRARRSRRARPDDRHPGGARPGQGEEDPGGLRRRDGRPQGPGGGQDEGQKRGPHGRERRPRQGHRFRGRRKSRDVPVARRADEDPAPGDQARDRRSRVGRSGGPPCANALSSSTISRSGPRSSRNAAPISVSGPRRQGPLRRGRAPRRRGAPDRAGRCPPRRPPGGRRDGRPCPGRSPSSPRSPPAATFASFGDLEAAVRACTRCPLCRLRTQAVPGEGNLKTELMFVGEAPGRDEDAQGRPFVGRAGQLLRRIITNAMHFREDEVYITNVVKCRPPENRVPARDEIEACSPYLVQQIALIKPRVIVTLGKTPADFFIPSRRAMGELRGNFFEYLGIPLMPTFHPSYLVRNEGNQELKRMVWEDMKKVLARLGRT